MLSFRQYLFCQNSLNQHSPKFFLTKVSSFTVVGILNNANARQCFFLASPEMSCKFTN